jgi:hypothetical protein
VIVAVSDGIVIGGPSHGRRLSTRGRRPGDIERVALRDLAPLTAPVDIDDPRAMEFSACSYRLCVVCLRRGERLLYWVPASVPPSDELLHVFRIAVGGSVF